MNQDVHGKADPAVCAHNNFRVALSVTKVVKGNHTRFMADLNIYCDDCDKPFKWLGLPVGASFGGPMRSFDGLELRAPMAPEDDLEVADEPWEPARPVSQYRSTQ